MLSEKTAFNLLPWIVFLLPFFPNSSRLEYAFVSIPIHFSHIRLPFSLPPPHSYLAGYGWLVTTILLQWFAYPVSATRTDRHYVLNQHHLIPVTIYYCPADIFLGIPGGLRMVANCRNRVAFRTDCSNLNSKQFSGRVKG